MSNVKKTETTVMEIAPLVRLYQKARIKPVGPGILVNFEFKQLSDAELFFDLLSQHLPIIHPEYPLSKDKVVVLTDEQYYYCTLCVKSNDESKFAAFFADHYLLKSLRADEFDFSDAFIKGIIPGEKGARRQNLRPYNKASHTITPQRQVSERLNKPPMYPAELKTHYSQIQSTSFLDNELRSTVFGAWKGRKDKLYGLMTHCDDALMNRLLVSDSGTVVRPYDFTPAKKNDTEFTAELARWCELLFSPEELTAFKAKNLNVRKAQGGTNEVMARLRFNPYRSVVAICGNTLEARLLAYDFSQELLQEFSVYAQRLNIKLNPKYKIPIIFYSPNYSRSFLNKYGHHVRLYTQTMRDTDVNEACCLYNTPSERVKKFAQSEYDFLLGLPETTSALLLEEGSVAGRPLALEMIDRGYVRMLMRLLRSPGDHLATQVFDELLKRGAIKENDSVIAELINVEAFDIANTLIRETKTDKFKLLFRESLLSEHLLSRGNPRQLNYMELDKILLTRIRWSAIKVSLKEFPSADKVLLGALLGSAVGEQRHSEANFLLKMGADKSIAQYGITPITNAARRCDWKMVEIFSQYTTDPEDKAEYGNAVVLALSSKEIELALKLIEAGAKPEVRGVPRECLKIIIDTVDNLQLNESLRQFIFDYLQYYVKRPDNQRLLHDLLQEAISQKRYHVAHFLLRADGQIPLHYAAEHHDWPMVRAFSQHQAEAGEEAVYGGAMLSALREGELELAKQLLDKGAKPTWHYERLGSYPLNTAHFYAAIEELKKSETVDARQIIERYYHQSCYEVFLDWQSVTSHLLLDTPIGDTPLALAMMREGHTGILIRLLNKQESLADEVFNALAAKNLIQKNDQLIAQFVVEQAFDYADKLIRATQSCKSELCYRDTSLNEYLVLHGCQQQLEYMGFELILGNLAQQKAWEKVRMLIEKYPTLDGALLQLALLEACRQRLSSEVDFLLKKGAKRAVDSNSLSPIVESAALEDWSTVSLFSRYRTDAEDLANYGFAMDHAFLSGQLGVAKQLLDAGAIPRWWCEGVGPLDLKTARFYEAIEELEKWRGTDGDRIINSNWNKIYYHYFHQSCYDLLLELPDLSAMHLVARIHGIALARRLIIQGNLGTLNNLFAKKKTLADEVFSQLFVNKQLRQNDDEIAVLICAEAFELADKMIAATNSDKFWLYRDFQGNVLLADYLIASGSLAQIHYMGAKKMLILAAKQGAWEQVKTWLSQIQDKTLYGDVMIQALRFRQLEFARALLDQGAIPTWHHNGVIYPLKASRFYEAADHLEKTDSNEPQMLIDRLYDRFHRKACYGLLLELPEVTSTLLLDEFCFSMPLAFWMIDEGCSRILIRLLQKNLKLRSEVFDVLLAEAVIKKNDPTIAELICVEEFELADKLMLATKSNKNQLRYGECSLTDHLVAQGNLNHWVYIGIETIILKIAENGDWGRVLSFIEENAHYFNPTLLGKLLVESCQQSHADASDFLLRRGADRTFIKNCAPALVIAADQQDWAIVTMFSQHQSDPEDNAEYGYALVQALRHGQRELATTLFSCGARSIDRSHVGYQLESTLFYAVQREYNDLLAPLLQYEIGRELANWEWQIRINWSTSRKFHLYPHCFHRILLARDLAEAKNNPSATVLFEQFVSLDFAVIGSERTPDNSNFEPYLCCQLFLEALAMDDVAFAEHRLLKYAHQYHLLAEDDPCVMHAIKQFRPVVLYGIQDFTREVRPIIYKNLRQIFEKYLGHSKALNVGRDLGVKTNKPLTITFFSPVLSDEQFVKRLLIDNKAKDDVFTDPVNLNDNTHPAVVVF
jgi:hypothetical protein